MSLRISHSVPIRGNRCLRICFNDDIGSYIDIDANGHFVDGMFAPGTEAHRERMALIQQSAPKGLEWLS